jgi:hypothetical protein
MYLLEIDDDNGFRLTEDYIDIPVPPYAVISHTWALDEVTSDDIRHGNWREKAGFAKLELFARQARKDDLRFLWIDTCCISNALSHSEAIYATFRWFRQASRCYVYLSDVREALWEHDFEHSRWFTRSWTLQELLAPSSVEFFSNDGSLLGDKRTLENKILHITGIPSSALRGASLEGFSVDERISWM